MRYRGTVGELRTKRVQFRSPIEQRQYGRVAMVIVAGADDTRLYQPTHKLAYNLWSTESRHPRTSCRLEVSEGVGFTASIVAETR